MPVDRSAARRRFDRRVTDRRPALAAALHHGQPQGQAVHERGGELQRLRRGVPRAGRFAFDYATCRAGWCSTRATSTATASTLAGGAGEPPPQWVTSRRRLRTSPSKLGMPRERSSDRRALECAGRAPAVTTTSIAARPRTTIGGATRSARRRHRATLGPLDQGPYYAVEIKSGALGTEGRPPDRRERQRAGRRRCADRRALRGGNVMASPMGMTYGGAGGTIAPGMVFGFLAGPPRGGHRCSRSARTRRRGKPQRRAERMFGGAERRRHGRGSGMGAQPPRRSRTRAPASCSAT